MSKHDTRYSSIRSVSDLQRARRKIRVMRMVNESYLAQDVEELKYRLSPHAIAEEAKKRLLSSRAWCNTLTLIRILSNMRDSLRK